MRVERRLTMRLPPRWLQWWRAVRYPHAVQTVASSTPWWFHWFAWVVPYRLRTVHRWYASAGGYFWLPCPLCGVPFGGHEWRSVGGRLASVPDPCGSRNMSTGICPRCTRAGRGVDVDLGEAA